MKNNSEDLAILLITGALSLFILSAALIIYIYFYQKRQNSFVEEKETLHKKFREELLKSQMEVQETTMASIAMELHDNIGQLLSSSKMLLGITQRNLSAIPPTLQTADESLGKAIIEIRQLSKSLNQDWLKKFNLIENLHAEVARINTANLVKVQLSTPKEVNLNPEEQIILFRILQESLQNSIKHAEATSIDINIQDTEKSLKLFITDNGIGFEQEKKSAGLGLENMKQRTQLLGGNISWTTAKNEGCSVAINIPNKL